MDFVVDALLKFLEFIADYVPKVFSRIKKLFKRKSKDDN